LVIFSMDYQYIFVQPVLCTKELILLKMKILRAMNGKLLPEIEKLVFNCTTGFNPLHLFDGLETRPTYYVYNRRTS
jgi:hypothetical protein